MPLGNSIGNLVAGAALRRRFSWYILSSASSSKDSASLASSGKVAKPALTARGVRVPTTEGVRDYQLTDPLQDIREFVASEPRRQIGSPATLLQAISDVLDDPVAREETVFVIRAADLHDVKSGANGTCGTLCTSATKYDYVTGLGSPIAKTLIPALVAQP